MSLLKQQNFLARLYTDENLRKRFLQKPEQIGAENDLSDKEIKELAAVLPEELNFFADSLFRKRLREVEKILPLTRKALSENFSLYFRKFSQTYNPQTVKKHFEDAIEFCLFLQENDVEPSLAKDAAKFEQARLQFNSGAKNFVFSRFTCDIRKILQNFSEEKSIAKSDFRKKKTFAIWLRVGKIKRHFIW